MDRRKFLQGLMAGGMIVAGELWIPGQKLISIPSGKIYTGQLFAMRAKIIEYIGPENKTVSVKAFYEWIADYASDAFKRDIPFLRGDIDTHYVSLASGVRMKNPEHLVEGTLEQDRLAMPHSQAALGDREYWSSQFDLKDDELMTDKIYQPDYYSTPRERHTENDIGEKGWK